jgi:hypothetical protein
MNILRALCPLILLAFLSSCETFMEEPEIRCLPLSMTATVVEGNTSSRIMADFHYIEGTALIDRITWNNHQTHYFDYDDQGRMTVVRQVKVKEKVQAEMWFRYQGEQVSRILLVDKPLDYVYLEPTDSIYTGYIEYQYDGSDISIETHFEVNEHAEAMRTKATEYIYDAMGNILSRTTHFFDDHETQGTSGNSRDETVNFTYDQHKHPFAELQYYFEGESFVNHPLTRSSDYGDLEYQYDVRTNDYGYPEMIFEILAGNNTRIIRYTYEKI